MRRSVGGSLRQGAQRLRRHEGASAGSRGHVTSRYKCPCAIHALAQKKEEGLVAGSFGVLRSIFTLVLTEADPSEAAQVEVARAEAHRQRAAAASAAAPPPLAAARAAAAARGARHRRRP